MTVWILISFSIKNKYISPLSAFGNERNKLYASSYILISIIQNYFIFMIIFIIIIKDKDLQHEEIKWLDQGDIVER